MHGALPNGPSDATLRHALERVVRRGFPGADDAVLARLVDEQCAALAEPEAGRPAVFADGDAVAVGVTDPSRPRMWLLGFTPGGDAPPERAAAALGALEQHTRTLGPAARLTTGGPPACYLFSGVPADDAATLRFLEQRGFVETARHVDLRVTLSPPAPPDPRVRRADPLEREGVFAWVTRAFALAWGRECRRGLGHGGAYVAGAPGEYVGFCSHSGHNAALGTFGPLGVLPEARRGGLGAALARAALDDLRARGFATATIPWVAPELVAFYTRLTDGVQVAERRVLTRTCD